MRFILISAALLAGANATPALAGGPVSQATPAAAPVPEDDADDADAEEPAKLKPSDLDMSKLMGMFDKMFPAQPDPSPQRLALARTTAAGVLPNGAYASAFDEFAGGMVDHFLSLRESDLVAGTRDGKPPSKLTLRQEITKNDPHFEERLKIIRRVVREELVKLSNVLEPKMREGLARSIARRFDERQLTDINAFMATESGRAFAGQTMRMWVDPDVMRSMMQTFPQMIAAMPGAIERLDSETAHLPKPKKKANKKAEDEPTT